jgi:2'-5' RNA ligase
MPEPQAQSRVRLFIAISLPEDVKDRMQEAQNHLRQAVMANCVRWARPQQFHLTLRFLGGVEVESISALKESVRAACHPFAPLRLTAAGIGFFPGPRSPRVVWVGITDSARGLAPLQQAVQVATASFTAEEPESRFLGHVTLGRVKGIRRAEAEALTVAAARFTGSLFGEWVASEVKLIRSELSPAGARYTELESFPLQSPP